MLFHQHPWEVPQRPWGSKGRWGGVSRGVRPSSPLLPEQLLHALHILFIEKSPDAKINQEKCLKPLDCIIPEVPPTSKYFMKTFLEPVHILSW